MCIYIYIEISMYKICCPRDLKSQDWRHAFQEFDHLCSFCYKRASHDENELEIYRGQERRTEKHRKEIHREKLQDREKKRETKPYVC